MAPPAPKSGPISATAVQSSLDTIRQSVSSLETCTSTTHSILNTILFPLSTKTNSKATVPRVTGTKTGKRRPPSAHSEAGDKLSILERYKLATEVVNTALKVLNTASKEVQTPHQTPEQTLLQTTPRHTRQTVHLEAKSNLTSKAGPNSLKSKYSSKANPPQIAQQHPATWIAECSCLAIGYIYSVHNLNEIPNLPLPKEPLQIERAHHNLIIRLIILKMYDIVLRELSVLKKRLEGFIEGREKQNIVNWAAGEGYGKENKKPSSTLEKDLREKPTYVGEENAALLFAFKCTPLTPVVTEFVVGFQMSVMRCIIGMGRQGAIDALVALLSAPNNTLSLIKTLPNPSLKLTALDTLLINCCPSTSSSADVVANYNVSSLSPSSVLRLQHYALEARVIYKTKTTEEFWESIIKCITAFCRRYPPKEGGKDRYRVVKEVILRFQKAVSGELPVDILQMLSTVAQDSGNAVDALEWLEQANSVFDQKETGGGKELNDAAKSARLVKVASMSLKAYGLTLTSGPSPASVIMKVKNAMNSVDMVAKVKVDDLEKLLQEVAIFRRAATLVAIPPFPTITQESEDLLDTRKRLKELCADVSEMSIRFFRKYISLQTKKCSRVKRLASPAVDFISTKVRHEASSGGRAFLENWSKLDESLLNCLDLAKLLSEGESQEQPNETDSNEMREEGCSKESDFERISAAYWKAACALKKLGAEKEGLRAIKRSVTALIGRSKEETVRGGLAAKLEKLGNGFYKAAEIERAEEAYNEGIKLLIDEGIVDEILHLADNSGLSEIFGDNRVGMMLGKMLDGVVKCVIKDVSKRRQKSPLWDGVPFDNEALNREARGLILEWQLRGMCGMAAKDLRIAKSTTERLLELYTEEEPLRRARVISKILRFQVDNPTFMDDRVALELGEEVETLAPLHRDLLLKPRRDDIVSSCLVSYAFLHYRASEPRPDFLQTALFLWRNAIESCHEWGRLFERIEDPEELTTQLYILVDFFELKGLCFHRISALRSLVLIKGIEDQIDYNALIKLHSILGLQYLRMGYSGKAGMMLAKASSWTEKEGVWEETRVRWHVAYTEYLVGIGNLEKAKEHYDAATKIVDGDTSMFESRKVAPKLERRVMLNRMLADASYVMSILCFELGNCNDSLCHVRRCIRLNQRSWAVLEQLAKDSTALSTKDAYPRIVLNIFDSDLQQLIDGVDCLSFSNSNTASRPVQSTTLIALNAPLLWTLVTSLYLCLIHASSIYRHQGMIREAMFNMEQALKAVEAVNATPLIAHALSIFGDLKIRAGALSEGADMLEKATELRAEIDKSKEIVSLDCTVGYLHGKNRLWEEEWGAYEHAEAKLAALMSPGFIKNIDELVLASETSNDGAMESTKKPRTQKKLPAHARTKSATKTAHTASTCATHIDKGIVTECPSLLKMKGNILRLKAYNLAMQNQVEQADLLLREAGKLPSGQNEIIYQRLVSAKHLLLEGLALLPLDPVFCVLQDSTISLPSITTPKSVTVQVPEDVPVHKPKKRQSGKVTREPYVEKTVASHLVETLTKARDSVADIHIYAAKVGSTSMVHSVSLLLSGVIMLLSAVAPGTSKGVCHPMFASYSLELNKGLPLLREKDAIQAEKVAAKKESLSWPQVSLLEGDSFNAVSTPFAFSSFQRDYIDIIPQGWAAVSISLSEAQDELYISRFQSGQGQLMLRLPLTRHNSRDDSEEVFEYNSGIKMLKDILEKVNTSTHAAKVATAGSKESKMEWWAERECLDEELGTLLTNIEHCWLGGFKGVFGQYPRHPELLRHFRTTFEKILAKHLPSRQLRRGGKRGGTTGEALDLVKIDPRILDLFVGLGNPAKLKIENDVEEEQESMDNSLLDLLWFIFDILQFHGERNAYDEIDFDAIIVDVMEALRGYYQQLSYVPKSEHEITQYTILILDKNVHIIPWESLPCLSGRAVSRLPSLACLRSILTSPKMDTDQVNPGVYIDENKGTWILNPTGDLTSTQGAFDKELQALIPTGWTGISSRAPSEIEFARALEHSEILLYFGHGSGGQFIRSRTVKKLDSCAVALLMGCSSGALKDAGEFEPHGMPLAYLIAGSAAVVANLWDVTDKDIDRFSKKVLEDWGLFKAGSTGARKAKETTRSRSKSRERSQKLLVARDALDDGGLFGMAPAKGSISLVQAIARGRKECHLKYLNGAAPVVYGVPVYLA